MHFMDPSNTARTRHPSSQPRVAAGVPTGGEFTDHDRAEDSVSLAAPERITARTPLDPKAALQFAEQVIAGKATRFRIYDQSTRDDIAQDSVLSVLTTMSNGRADGLTGGLLANAVKHAMTTAISERTGVHRNEDVRALRMLDAQIEAFTHEQGREPTSRERNELARQIRDSWPDPRHRPLKGYQARVIQEVIHQSLDAQQLAGGVDPADECDDAYALRQLDDDVAFGRVSKDQAMLRLWNVVAKEEGAAVARRRLPPGTNVRKYKRTITAAGGPLEIARRYVLTGEYTPEVEAMLYPFDVLDRRQALDVARLLASRGSAAVLLWKSAALVSEHAGR